MEQAHFADACERFDYLFEKHLDGKLPDREREEFRGLIGGSPVLQDRYVRRIGQAHALKKIFAAANPRIPAAPLKKAARADAARGAGLAIKGAFAAAACILIAAGLLIYNHFQAQPGPGLIRTQIAAAMPGAAVERGGELIPATADMWLRADDVIDTTRAIAGSSLEPARLKITCPNEETVIYVDRNTRFQILNETQGKRYRLEAGRIEAVVARQPPDRPLVFASPQAEAVVLGTALEFRATKDTARLAVTEGLATFRRLDLPVTLEVSSGGYAMAGPGITLATNARRPGPGESLRVIEDHEGPLAWQQSPYSARLAFGIIPVAHRGRNGLRVVYEPEAGDRWNYGAIVHPFSMKPGDHALRFFIHVERYEGNASWNIQVRQRDGSCWFLGDGLFHDLGKGWNFVELEYPRAPVNAYGDGAYRPAEVKDLLFSVCLRPAAFVVDDFSVVSGKRP